jgi:hypothetical protein
LELERQRRELDHQIALVTYLQSPIRKLSTEILSNIFGLVARNDFNSYKGANTTTDRKLLSSQWYLQGYTLGSVSQRWRSLALSLPAMWSVIYVKLSGKAELKCREEFTAEAIRAILQRAGTHPLDIKIEIVDAISPTEHPIWMALLASRLQWKSFRLTATPSVSRAMRESLFVKSRPWASLPHLEVLSMNSLFDTSFFFQDATLLKTFLCLGPGAELQSQLFPTNQIINLHLIWTKHPIPMLARALSPFRNLRSLCLRLFSDFDESVPISLPAQCQILTLDLSHYEGDYIRLPSLQETPIISTLNIQGPCEDQPLYLSVNSTEKFLKTSQTTLTCLTMTQIDIDPEELLPFLQNTRQLTSLCLEEVDNSSERSFFQPALLKKMQHLSSNGRDFCLLPKLQLLRLRARCVQVQDSDIAGMAVERVLGGLRHFKLHMTDRQFNSEAFSEVCALRSSSFWAEITGTRWPERHALEGDGLTDILQVSFPI